MPKGRMLNKKISYDIKVAKLSFKAKFLYTWLIPHLDIRGRHYGNPEVIKGTVVPYVKEFNHKTIIECIEEMHQYDLIKYYGDDIAKYIEFNGFYKNQKLREDREGESEIPTPELLQSNSRVTPTLIPPKLREVKLSKDNICASGDAQNSFSINQLTDMFERIWLRYPKRKGKKSAFNHFKADIKTEQNWTDMKIALETYKDHIKAKKTDMQYILNGSTWFNNWQDWITPPDERNEFNE